jgi:hypothetical protein
MGNAWSYHTSEPNHSSTCRGCILGVRGKGCRPIFGRSLPYSKRYKTIIRSIDEFLAQGIVKWL